MSFAKIIETFWSREVTDAHFESKTHKDIISIIMQTQAKFFICFSKINTKLFSGESKYPLITKVRPSS